MVIERCLECPTVKCPAVSTAFQKGYSDLTTLTPVLSYKLLQSHDKSAEKRKDESCLLVFMMPADGHQQTPAVTAENYPLCTCTNCDFGNLLLLIGRKFDLKCEFMIIRTSETMIPKFHCDNA